MIQIVIPLSIGKNPVNNQQPSIAMWSKSTVSFGVIQNCKVTGSNSPINGCGALHEGFFGSKQNDPEVV